jgi:hypothetical protein
LVDLADSYLDWLRRHPDAHIPETNANRMCELAVLFIPKIGQDQGGWILMSSTPRGAKHAEIWKHVLEREPQSRRCQDGLTCGW